MSANVMSATLNSFELCAFGDTLNDENWEGKIRTLTCDRCYMKVRSTHYHCLQCPNFDLCKSCAARGIYCENDTHVWSKAKVIHGFRSRVGAQLITSGGNALRLNASPYPSLFRPSDEAATPETLFENEHRFINKDNPREILIYTSGSCLDNGGQNPRGGCAFVYRPDAYTNDGEVTHFGSVYFALESSGPTDRDYTPTSNRAELRAVIAALQFKDWSTDCNRAWRSVVIATESEYVALGATGWAQVWSSSGWLLVNKNRAVKNKDLWYLLLEEIMQLQEGGVNVSFWRIPGHLDLHTCGKARLGAIKPPQSKYRKIMYAGPLELSYTISEY